MITMEEEGSFRPPSAETPVAFLTRVNNEVASDSIARGDLKLAFFRLQDALQRVSSALSCCCDGQMEEEGEPDGSLQSSAASRIHLQAIPSPGCDEFGSIRQTGVVGCAFRIHDLGSTPHQYDDLHLALQRVSSVVIFNMALVCHLQHLESSSHSIREDLLQHCLFLYDQVFQICETEASPMYLSLCQNCAVIFVDAGKVANAIQWKGRLSDAIHKHYTVCPLPFLLCHSAIFGAAQAA